MPATDERDDERGERALQLEELELARGGSDGEKGARELTLEELRRATGGCGRSGPDGFAWRVASPEDRARPEPRLFEPRPRR